MLKDHTVSLVNNYTAYIWAPWSNGLKMSRYYFTIYNYDIDFNDSPILSIIVYLWMIKWKPNLVGKILFVRLLLKQSKSIYGHIRFYEYLKLLISQWPFEIPQIDNISLY